jgi:uncharacterized protein
VVSESPEQGNATAQGNLGTMYGSGQGVPQDDAQAFAWFRKAAEQGAGFAQMKLGIMYKLGRGVPQDDVHAYMWVILGLSSASGEHDLDLGDAAAHDLGVKVRDQFAANMTPAQIVEAQQMAREWKPK